MSRARKKTSKAVKRKRTGPVKRKDAARRRAARRNPSVTWSRSSKRIAGEERPVWTAQLHGTPYRISQSWSRRPSKKGPNAPWVKDKKVFVVEVSDGGWSRIDKDTHPKLEAAQRAAAADAKKHYGPLPAAEQKKALDKVKRKRGYKTLLIKIVELDFYEPEPDSHEMKLAKGFVDAGLATWSAENIVPTKKARDAYGALSYR